MVTYNGVNIDSGYGMLPEPMLTLNSEVLWHSTKINFTSRAQDSILYNEFKNYSNNDI